MLFSFDPGCANRWRWLREVYFYPHANKTKGKMWVIGGGKVARWSDRGIDVGSDVSSCRIIAVFCGVCGNVNIYVFYFYNKTWLMTRRPKLFLIDGDFSCFSLTNRCLTSVRFLFYHRQLFVSFTWLALSVLRPNISTFIKWNNIRRWK